MGIVYIPSVLLQKHVVPSQSSLDHGLVNRCWLSIGFLIGHFPLLLVLNLVLLHFCLDCHVVKWWGPS